MYNVRIHGRSELSTDIGLGTRWSDLGVFSLTLQRRLESLDEI